MDTKEQLNWVFKHFDELSGQEVYEILALRSLVFVVEQQCIFLDMDGLDQQAHHLMGYKDKKLVAYTRIFRKGISYPDYPSIGRVVTSPQVRGKSYGRMLMQESLKRLFELYGQIPVKIGAQLYLKNFYESLGFRQSGDMYLEDGIEHIPMVKPINPED